MSEKDKLDAKFAAAFSTSNEEKSCGCTGHTSPISHPGLPGTLGKDVPTHVKIKMVTEAINRLLQEKNKRYGDSALNPLGAFSKLSAEDAIRIRLDDKLKRIMNSTELRKNDVADIIGYLILLSISKDWLNFDELID